MPGRYVVDPGGEVIVKVPGKPEDYIRLLQCITCKTTEILPAYEGPAKYDVVLHELHHKHGGHEDDAVRRHECNLFLIERKHWDSTRMRREIHKRIWSGVKGFVPEYYATRDTLVDDALKCFKQHHNPDVCIDWRSDTKLLGNPAVRERRELSREIGRDLPPSDIRRWLCDFCPVASKVAERMRMERGLYE